jgi:hypothetical protein
MDRLRCHRGREMSLNRPVGQSLLLNLYSMFGVRTMNELRGRIALVACASRDAMSQWVSAGSYSSG